MLKEFVFSQWSKPAVADPPPRSVYDWVLVAVLIVATIVEGILRTDLWMPGLAIVLGIVPVLTLPFRRSDPLRAVFVAFSAHALSELIPTLAGEESIFIVSGGIYALMLPYALFRWASGRHGVIGLLFVVVTHLFAHPLSLIDAAFVIVFFLFPAEVGASVRHRVAAKRKMIDEIRSNERQEIARELHDTVAHHVSAIAVRAQAGRIQSSSDPAGASAALETIEQEASKTLTEMRSMVRLLRADEIAELSPQPGVADLEELARADDDLPRITVSVAAGAGEPAAHLGAALYRIAQESITNALRHARSPHEIRVMVDGDEDSVRLSVLDDGGTVAINRAGGGFGVLGMKERAKLLGGTLEAGPVADGGWKVEAVLPRVGAAR